MYKLSMFRLGIGYFSVKQRLYLTTFSRRNTSELTLLT